MIPASQISYKTEEKNVISLKIKNPKAKIPISV